MFLFIGRLFDFHVLDMIELGVDKFKSMAEIEVHFIYFKEENLS